ncbi:uncharacterized protein LAJ45_05072 [Morchella importuna]|uniref:uncharacterized protein n=1 Tax=Morchella importuna TaxID=1174673 RepID=UPI001E8DE1BE|nr:uncharacterized protein LAJ45_05072 [Morchella importuna]KAH8150890.1 hypothetical protein LAJ45_05072 [Morchella importuna]
MRTKAGQKDTYPPISIIIIDTQLAMEESSLVVQLDNSSTRNILPVIVRLTPFVKIAFLYPLAYSQRSNEKHNIRITWKQCNTSDTVGTKGYASKEPLVPCRPKTSLKILHLI